MSGASRTAAAVVSCRLARERVRLAFALVLGLAAVIAWCGSARAAEPEFPTLTGQIVDDANLLSAEDKAAILTDLQALEGKSSDQLVVVTLPSLQGFSIEDFGYKLGRHWGIGQDGKDNGVLLIVAPNERKVRIEVGKRLDPVLTDSLSKIVIQNAILPGFRRGDFAAGIKAGVTDIKDILLGDAAGVEERARGMNSGGDTEIDYIALAILLLWVAIFVYVIYVQSQQARTVPTRLDRRRGRRQYSDDGGVIVVPSGSGGWEGGGWSGGGGGWSGGGGTFSGGGASGDW